MNRGAIFFLTILYTTTLLSEEPAVSPPQARDLSRLTVDEMCALELPELTKSAQAIADRLDQRFKGQKPDGTSIPDNDPEAQYTLPQGDPSGTSKNAAEGHLLRLERWRKTCLDSADGKSSLYEIERAKFAEVAKRYDAETNRVKLTKDPARKEGFRERQKLEKAGPLGNLYGRWFDLLKDEIKIWRTAARKNK